MLELQGVGGLDGVENPGHNDSFGQIHLLDSGSL